MTTPTPPTFRRRVEGGWTLVMCDRCGAAIVDVPGARKAHVEFHQNLRALVRWARSQSAPDLAAEDPA